MKKQNKNPGLSLIGDLVVLGAVSVGALLETFGLPLVVAYVICKVIL